MSRHIDYLMTLRDLRRRIEDEYVLDYFPHENISILHEIQKENKK